MILQKRMKKLSIVYLLQVNMVNEWPCSGLIMQGLLIVMAFKPIQVEVCGPGEIGSSMPTIKICHLISLPLNKLLVICSPMQPNLKSLQQVLIETIGLMVKAA